MRVESGRAGPRVLFASSSVGLGHVARDLHLRRLMEFGDVEWLTAGSALGFLEANGEKVHPASRLLRSLGDVIGGSLIGGCRVRMRPGPIRDLYSAVRSNADLIDDAVDLGSYDLVVADEFWELLLSGRRPGKGVFLTDFVDLSPGLWRMPLRPFIRRLGDAIRRRAVERFDLRVHVGMWGEAGGFWHPGQLVTDAAVASGGSGGPVVVNVGGTRAGCGMAAGLGPELRARGVDFTVIGPCGEFTGNPARILSGASAVITLAGYSSLVEVALLRKPAVVVPIRGHFEHAENARAFSGRSGYRVVPCSDGRAQAEALLEVMGEEPDPPPVVDSSEEIARAILELA
ncbi:MAG: glycosyltransferase [Nitrososphaeria archaeon]